MHHIDTIAIHGGQEPDKETGAVMPPIHLSTTYAQDGPGNHKGFEYARTDNPTRRTLEHCMAALEGGDHALAFSSGCAAMTTLFHTLKPGDHIIACDDVYGGTFRILDQVMKPLGIESSWVDLTDLGALEKAFRPNTKMVFIETPTNPMLKVIDIEPVTALAKKAGAVSVVDNTFATPCLQRPLFMGADMVLHSTTKYINGHSDAVGGVIVLKDDTHNEKLRFLQNAIGAVPSPFDCFLVLRGIKTLPVRVDRSSDSAAVIAEWLRSRDEVAKVYYPGCDNHPQFEVAKRQMSKAGGMISFEIKGGLPGASAFLKTVEIFVCAESLGGVESLVEHPALMTHGSVPKESRDKLGITDGLIRLSVGLEGRDDLQKDIENGLIAARKT